MWLFLVEAGFVGFVLTLFGLVWRGFDRDGRARQGLAVWIMAAIGFLAVWLVALSRVPRP